MAHMSRLPAHWGRPGMLADWPDWSDILPPMAPFGEMVRSLRTEAVRVEEYVEDHTMVVRAELPGIDPDKDVSITVSEGALEIEAERTQTHTSETAQEFRSEFRYGSSRRVVPLPAGAHEDDVSASYDDGILEVRVPLSEEPTEEKPRTIPIQHT